MPSRLSVCSLLTSLTLLVAATVLPETSSAGGLKLPFGRAARLLHLTKERDCVQQLAHDIDSLEKQLNDDGTIIAKTPDIWGEARLTKHRREFEEQLAKNIDQFQLLLNASIRRSDQAFLANALAIQSALTNSAKIPVAETDAGTFSQVNAMIAPPVITTAAAPAEDGAAVVTQGAIVRTQPGSAPTSVVGTGGFVDSSISIEPTIHLDQLKRYVNHLNEIRRVNEGDDTADSPGYSMRLVRVPVSVLPGDHTRIGHGAEVTMTATPVISRELLAPTFRGLVMHELVNKFRVPLGSVLNNPDLRAKSQSIDALYGVLKNLLKTSGLATMPFSGVWPEDSRRVKSESKVITPTPKVLEPFPRQEDPTLGIPIPMDDEDEWEKIDQLLDDPKIKAFFEDPIVEKYVQGRDLKVVVRRPDTLQMLKSSGIRELVRLRYGNEFSQLDQLLRLLQNVTAAQKSPTGSSGIWYENVDRSDESFEQNSNFHQLTFQVKSTFQSYTSSGHPHGSDLFPLTSWSRVYGVFELLKLAIEARDRIVGRLAAPDVPAEPAAIERYLKEHLDAAYSLLELPENDYLWQHCSRELVIAVRVTNRTQLDQLRAAFFSDLQAAGYPSNLDETLGIFAWTIIVEAALMNEELIRDIRRVSADRGQNMPRIDQDTFCPVPQDGGSSACQCSDPEGLRFFLPVPTEQARQTFADYVRCRWPIQVFALDPVTQDQNVADSFSMRRELQLAMALAFASGNTNIQNVTRFVRRMEMDMETIALNRTAVGFTHGPDTFGWRFAPRVQTPDEEGNLTVAFRDLLLGRQSKDSKLRQHRLEPGIRECYAMIVMPSFVPYVELDVRSNWFKLTAPDKTRTKVEEHVDWSRQIRDMKHLANRCCQDHAYQYRRGEVARLYRRIDQLSRKLPIQTVSAQMPIENQLGGSSLFRNGKDTLHPELHYWYGFAGIQPDKDTTLFLKGSNFSVHDTQVIAGDQSVKFKLVSREIMEVTIPAGVLQYKRSGHILKEGVDLHIATPYGVTGQLHIPVIPSATQTTNARFAWSTGNHQLKYRYSRTVVSGVKTDVAIADEAIQLRLPHQHSISVPAGMIPHSSVKITLAGQTTSDFSFTNPLFTYEIADVRFDKQSKQYAIDGAHVINLHKAIKNGVSRYINANLNKDNLPASIEIALTGILDFGGSTKIPLANQLKLQIFLEAQ